PAARGLLHIWCDASVIPYASITGTPNNCSRPWATFGGSAAELDRTNSRADSATSERSACPRARIAWCIVGTAVYHVGLINPNQSKNSVATNPGAQATFPPAVSEASSAATSPWI